MRRNLPKTLIIAALISTLYASYLHAESETSPPIDNQPALIKSLIAAENKISYTKEILEILNRLDNTYSRLYEKLIKGGKINIFFDPAHGKWPDGRWEGEATGRLSCTGVPEESYSIALSRELYRLLIRNKHIQVISTDEYIKVLTGNKDVYNNIPFTETVRLARETRSFLIISEHLNNISTILKAGGLINIPGIHITESKWGTAYLTYIKDSHRGFLTLYNKYDTTDMSRQYSLNLKKIQLARGMHVNNWNTGAVPDDRFCYFIDFPISVIFESGFISNPEEESFLNNKENQKIIAGSQYEALLESLKDVFGIDISGPEPVRVHTPSKEFIELLKLSRIAIFYIHKGETSRARKIISTIIKNYKNLNPAVIENYRGVSTTLLKAESCYNTARSHYKKKNYSKARKFSLVALKTLSAKPLFENISVQYKREFQRLGIVSAAKPHIEIKKMPPLSSIKVGKISRIPKLPKTSPIILTMENDRDLTSAVAKSLNPCNSDLAKIVTSLKNAHIVSRVRTSYRSESGKVRYRWKNIKNRIIFREGIYIVTLDHKLNVRRITRTNSVPLNPWKFQNHEYLKNSSFAINEREKSL